MYIDPKTVKDEYTDTKDHHRQWFQYFDEYERLARNKPSPKIADNLPKTTDGTLAGIIKEQPKRVVQQIPQGKVDCFDEDELAEIAGWVLTEQLLPWGNTNGTALQKGWTMINKALTYGVSASYTFFTNTDKQMHTDFVIPYIKDILIEKGKVFGPDANKLFMRSWYTKSDIQRIIDKEKKLQDKSKTYKSSWDLKALSDLKDSSETKKKEDETPFERERGINHEGIEIVHAFQDGVGSDFYSFSPNGDNDKMLRTWENKDPRGKMPINFLYADIDLSNPYGRGIVEQSGGIQNLIDHQMVMFQFLSTLMMAPPLQMWGNFPKNDKKLRPNATWDMGSAPNNKIEPYRVDNASIANFPQNYGLLKSQILNLNSSLDSSISASSGNPGFSKTPAGIKNNEERLSISDNYMRKQYESWFGDQCESALNIFFAEMEGEGDLTLGVDKLSRLTPETYEKYFDKKTNKIKIPYSTITEKVFKFQVDASSSEVKSKADNAEKLTELLRISQNVLSEEQKIKLVQAIAKEIGAEGVNKIFPDLESMGGLMDEEDRQRQLAEAVGQQQAQVGEQVPNSPSAQPQEIIAGQAQIPQPQLPMAQPMPVAPPATPLDAEIDALLRRGVPPEQIVRTLGG